MARLSYLLDSNILSEPSRPRPDDKVQSRLKAHRHEVCTAAPILHEMHYGLVQMPEGARKRHLIRYLDQVLRRPLAILPYDRDAALRHAGERARLASRGRTPPYVDGRPESMLMNFAINPKTLAGNWNFPTPIRFGSGRIRESTQTCREFEIEHLLLITDPGLAAMSMVTDAAPA